ncbi:uracil-DNA glycosylase family 4 [Bradyrhizobium sp. USDA 4341]
MTPDPLAPEVYEAIAEAEDIVTLEQVLLENLTLSLRELTDRYCFGWGDPTSPFVAILEQPGPVGLDGSPLAGAAGELWQGMLAGIEQTRRSTYMANFSPWPTLGGRALTLEEADMLKPFLRRHIALCKPQVIVLVGGNVGREMLGLPGNVFDQTGVWHEYDDGEIIIPARVVLHPALLLKDGALKEQSWSDMLAIARVLGGESPDVGH